MPPPSLFTSTIVADRPWSFEIDERVEVVEERDVPDDERDGPVRRRRRAERRRHDAVDPVGAAVRADRDRPLGRRQPAVQVADGHRVARPQDRPVRQRGGEGRERRALERLVERGEPARPSPGRRRAPRRSSRGSTTCAGRSTRGAPSARGPSPRRRRGRTSPGAARARASRRPRRSRRARAATRSSSWRIGLDVGIAPVRMTRSGRWASIHGPGRTSWSARLTTRDRSCGPGPQPGQRVGEDREAGRPGEAGERRGQLRVVVRARDDEAPGRAAEERRELRDAARRPGRAARRWPSVNGVGDGRVGAAGRRRGRSGPSGSSGSRNGTLSWTAPAGPAAAVATARPASERTCASVAGSPSNSGSSAYHLAARP